MHVLKNLLGNSSRASRQSKTAAPVCSCHIAGGGAWSPASVSWSRQLFPQCLSRGIGTSDLLPLWSLLWLVLVIMEKHDNEGGAKREAGADTVLAPPPFSLCLTCTHALLPIAVTSHDSANLRSGSVFTVKACRCTVPSANQRRPPPSEPPTSFLHFVFSRHNPETEFYHWQQYFSTTPAYCVSFLFIYCWLIDFNLNGDLGVKSPLDV